MAWAVPEYTRQEINRAGVALIADTEKVWVVNRDQMFQIVNNWRSSHSFPLQSIKMILLSRAKGVDPDALVAQRLKRLPSIEDKLRRFPDMRLAQIQDIGGCRAVVRNIVRLQALVKKYEEARVKNPTGRHEFVHDKNYIAQPKSDGYRSVHFVYRYRSNSKKHCVYNDLKIEIQIRTRLQHAWATAVETVGLFTEQALKSGRGEKEWRRFFALMSSAIASRESQPLVPDTPTDAVALKAELKEAAAKLDVASLMDGWNTAMRRLPPKNVTKAVAFLVVLDTKAHTYDVTGFTEDELGRASEEYLEIEKTTAAEPNIQGVLVSVSSVHAIRSAYPNYFVDNKAFIRALQFAIK